MKMKWSFQIPVVVAAATLFMLSSCAGNIDAAFCKKSGYSEFIRVLNGVNNLVGYYNKSTFTVSDYDSIFDSDKIELSIFPDNSSPDDGLMMAEPEKFKRKYKKVYIEKNLVGLNDKKAVTQFIGRLKDITGSIGNYNIDTPIEGATADYYNYLWLNSKNMEYGRVDYSQYFSDKFVYYFIDLHLNFEKFNSVPVSMVMRYDMATSEVIVSEVYIKSKDLFDAVQHTR